jgi:peptidyl-tRNA hydrolase, PTH1 family
VATYRWWLCIKRAARAKKKAEKKPQQPKAVVEPLQLVVGLGNPGAQYAQTRHNAGFWLLDALAYSHNAVFRLESRFHGYSCQLPVSNCRLLKPETYMNRSGQSVAALARFYRIPPTQILVVHDEIDLPPGNAKLKQGGGAGGHNGLKDIIQQLGSNQFWRLRIGVGHPGQREQVVNFVLTRPSAPEQDLIDDSIARALKLMPQILDGGIAKAMNHLHARPE